MYYHWDRFNKTLKSFEFLEKVKSKMLTERKDKENPDEIVGQVLTFTDIKKSNPILIINYEDTLSIDEIKKIQEYKVIPLNN